MEVQSTKCLGLKEVTIFGSLVSDAVREESKDKIHVLALVDCQVPGEPREDCPGVPRAVLPRACRAAYESLQGIAAQQLHLPGSKLTPGSQVDPGSV